MTVKISLLLGIDEQEKTMPDLEKKLEQMDQNEGEFDFDDDDDEIPEIGLKKRIRYKKN
jgi:hypothetical protein